MTISAQGSLSAGRTIVRLGDHHSWLALARTLCSLNLSESEMSLTFIESIASRPPDLWFACESYSSRSQSINGWTSFILDDQFSKEISIEICLIWSDRDDLSERFRWRDQPGYTRDTRKWHITRTHTHIQSRERERKPKEKTNQTNERAKQRNEKRYE